MMALFGTHGSLRGGPLFISAFYYAITLAPKANIIGTFGCRGEVKASLLEGLMKKARSFAVSPFPQCFAKNKLHQDKSNITICYYI